LFGVVRKLICLIAVIPSLTWACNGAIDTPAGPSAIVLTPAIFAAPAVVTAQALPTLTGRWRVSGTTAFRNVETGNTLRFGGCSGSFVITAQEGGRFTGSLATQGGGWNSDRFCTASATLTGELVADGAAQARLEGNSRNWPRPAVTPSCEFVSAGDGTWTGNATGDSIRLQTGDTLRCGVNVDGGIPGMPTANFERTVSLDFERW
jgi:hypothetical protein